MTAKTEDTDLIALPATIADIYGKGGEIEKIVGKIEETVRAETLEVETKKGRDRVRSVAYKVAQSKTRLDAAGKELTEEWLRKKQAVDAERRIVKQRLDALRDEVKAPLLQWEAEDEKRRAALDARLARLDADLLPRNATSAQLTEHLIEVQETVIDESWQEMEGKAEVAKDEAIAALEDRIRWAKESEEREAEIARMRAEADERERREAAEAAERAAKEKAAQEENERLRKQVEEAERRAKEAAEAAERQAKESAEAAERQKREAEEAAERAREEERQRAAAEKAEQESAEKERQQDMKKRRAAYRKMCAAVEGLDAVETVDLIMAGKMPHVQLVL